MVTKFGYVFGTEHSTDVCVCPHQKRNTKYNLIVFFLQDLVHITKK